MRLSDRVPPGDGLLSSYDAQIDSVDARRALRPGRPGPQTLRKYERWKRLYAEWAPGHGYQPSLAFITDRSAEEFTVWLTQDVPGVRGRYSPHAIGQALSALRYYAEREDANPMPTFRPAFARFHLYMDSLVEKGVIGSRQKRAILP